MFSRGFTLIEMLVVITIAAILLAVGIPMFNSTIASMRTSNATNSLLAAMELARSEAIRRGINVTVCRVADANVANPNCTMGAVGVFAANDWAAGWVVFTEGNPAGALGLFDPGGAAPDIDEVVFRQGVVDNTTPARTSINGSVGSVTYAPTGLRVGAAGAAGRFDVIYLDANNPPGLSPRCLMVAVAGQTAATRGACP